MRSSIRYTPIRLTFDGHVILHAFERVRIEKGFTYQAIGQRYGLDRSLIRTVVIGQNNLYCETKNTFKPLYYKIKGIFKIY